jgi:hypothetical protein
MVSSWEGKEEGGRGRKEEGGRGGRKGGGWLV